MSNLIVKGRRRTGLLVLLFGLMIVVLAACTDSDDPTATPVPPAATATTAATATPVPPAATATTAPLAAMETATPAAMETMAPAAMETMAPAAMETMAPTAMETATPPDPTAMSMPDSDGTGVMVDVLSVGDFGQILVGPNGLTLYIFDRDTEGVSNCSGGCLGAWPPLLTDYPPVALGDVTATIGTVTRDDGSTQVTVNGFPAYYWASDSSAGDTGGHGVGNVWWVFNGDGSPQRPAKVGIAEHATLGTILVDGGGLTLYLFDNDTAGVSNCSGGCLGAWPPLLTDYPPVALGDVTATIGTITRDDGSTQVTVNGFPAYYWASDSSAGDTGGHGVGNVWWVFNGDGSPQRPAKVGIAEHATLGTILVDGGGLTLYLFDNDTAGVSNCSGGCLGAWPPLLTDYPPVALGDVTATVGTITRDDGSTQVTVDEMPVYFWQNDAAPGDADGQGRNGVWWVMGADGSAVGN